MPKLSSFAIQTSLARRVPFFYGWIVIGVAFVTMAIAVNSRTAFSLLYPPILDEFGWSRGDTAAIFSIGFIASSIGTPLVGLLMGHLGPRLVMPLGALLVASGLLLGTFASALWQFYLTLGVLVIGGSIFISYIGHSMFLANWFNRQRGLAVGIAFSGVGFGGIVMFLWIQQIIVDIGWRVSCWVMAILLVVIVVPLNFLLQCQKPSELDLEPDGHAGDMSGSMISQSLVVDREWVETEWTLRRAMLTSRFWWLALTMGTGLFAWYAVQVHQSQYLLQLGFGETQVALALGVVVMSGVVGQIGLGHLSDRLGREWVWTLSLSGYVLCYSALLLLQQYPLVLLVYVMAAAQGILGYGLASMFGAMPADLFQGPNFAAIIGVVSVAANFGAGVGPWLTGYLYDVTGSYDDAWWLAIAVSLVSIGAVWMAAPRKVRLVAGQASR